MTAKKERRNYDEEFILKLAIIETRQSVVIDELKQVSRHLKEINGSITDYQVTKSKVETACLKLVELDADMNTTGKLLGSIKIKVWSIAGLIGAFSAFIGIVVGKLI